MSSNDYYTDIDMELFRSNFELIYYSLPNDDMQHPIRNLLEDIY